MITFIQSSDGYLMDSERIFIFSIKSPNLAIIRYMLILNIQLTLIKLMK